MQILLTNDDGIYADGIYAIYRELKKIGNVTVVAPDMERSSVGHGITLAYPIMYKRVDRKGRFFGYAVTGTPADCVKFAVSVILKKKPDIVVSGINLGQNDGCSVFYSGTVAGAREAALMGLPALALSLGTFTDPDFRYAGKIGAKIVRQAAKQKMPKGTFLNVNIPNQPEHKIKGIVATRQGTRPIHEEFRKRTDPSQRHYYWMTGRMPQYPKDLNIDTSALAHDYVTVTPIHCDMTDYGFLEKLKRWNIPQ